jgi:hypothetical protein
VELGLVDPHGVKGLGIHDVEAVAPVLQCFGEPLVVDDGVDNKWVSAWLWDAI